MTKRTLGIPSVENELLSSVRTPVAAVRSFGRLTRIALLVGAMLSTPLAQSQTSLTRLGAPEVVSRLGSPLWVKIPIEANEGIEDTGATARFSLGATPVNAAVPFIETAEVTLERRGKEYFLVIRSRKPINEPAVGIVVREQISNGVRSREFILLIDPAPAAGAPLPEAVAGESVVVSSTSLPSAWPAAHPDSPFAIGASGLKNAQPVDSRQIAAKPEAAAVPTQTIASRRAARRNPERTSRTQAAASVDAPQPRIDNRLGNQRTVPNNKTASPNRSRNAATGDQKLKLSLSADTLRTLPGADEATRAVLRERQQLVMDVDDLTAALLDRQQRVKQLEKQLIALEARMKQAQQTMDAFAPVPGAATMPGQTGSIEKPAIGSEPLAINSPPMVAETQPPSKVPAPPVTKVVVEPPPAPSGWLSGWSRTAVWQAILAAIIGIPLLFGFGWMIRRKMQARDESLRLDLENEEAAREAIIARPLRESAKNEKAGTTESVVSPPAGNLPPARTKYLGPDADIALSDDKDIQFELPEFVPTTKEPEVETEIESRRMQYLKTRYQDVAILNPPLSDPSKLLQRVGSLYDEGATEFAKRMLKYAAYSQPMTESYWLALFEVLLREKFVNDYVVNARWFRRYHPDSTSWRMVESIGYQMDPAEPLFAKAASSTNAPLQVGMWLPLGKSSEKTLSLMPGMRLELAS